MACISWGLGGAEIAPWRRPSRRTGPAKKCSLFVTHTPADNEVHSRSKEAGRTLVESFAETPARPDLCEETWPSWANRASHSRCCKRWDVGRAFARVGYASRPRARIGGRRMSGTGREWRTPCPIITIDSCAPIRDPSDHGEPRDSTFPVSGRFHRSSSDRRQRRASHPVSRIEPGRAASLQVRVRRARRMPWKRGVLGPGGRSRRKGLAGLV